MKEDAELLRAYACDRSEEAFAELVRRRVGLVYSVALRRTGDAHRAEDVAQRVFTDLARKAASLATRPVLAGWLHRSAHYAATDVLRAERSRAVREQEAHTMQQLNADEAPAPDWDKVRPVLDDALNEMDERDRDAILLRFIDGRPFAEVGARLALSENAARMRVERALDKLRLRLGRRGVTSTSAALAATLGHSAMATAPAGLALTVTGAALAGAAGAGAGATLATAFLMKTSTVVVSSLLAMGALGVAFLQTRQAHRAEEERAALARERDGLAARLRAAEELGFREKQRAAAAERQSALLRNGVSEPATPSSAPAASPPARTVAGTGGIVGVAGPYLPDTPEARRRNVHHGAGETYAPLFQRLGWSEVQRERFKDLLADRNEARHQTMTAAFAQGPIDRAAAQKIFTAAEAEFETQLRVHLGDAAADSYLYFEATSQLRSRADELVKALFYTDTPLTSTQALQLVDVMASHARNPQGKIDHAALNTEAVLAEAQTVLTAPQVAKFREMEARRAQQSAARGMSLRPAGGGN